MNKTYYNLLGTQFVFVVFFHKPTVVSISQWSWYYNISEMWPLLWNSKGRAQYYITAPYNLRVHGGRTSMGSYCSFICLWFHTCHVMNLFSPRSISSSDIISLIQRFTGAPYGNTHGNIQRIYSTALLYRAVWTL